jgi:hypothetical protein
VIDGVELEGLEYAKPAKEDGSEMAIDTYSEYNINTDLLEKRLQLPPQTDNDPSDRPLFNGTKVEEGGAFFETYSPNEDSEYNYADYQFMDFFSFDEDRQNEEDLSSETPWKRTTDTIFTIYGDTAIAKKEVRTGTNSDGSFWYESKSVLIKISEGKNDTIDTYNSNTEKH